MNSPSLPAFPKDYRNRLRRIDALSVRILWHVAYYDGPLDGVAVCNGMHCWFEMIHEDHEIRPRIAEDGERWNDYYARFLLVELTEEQFEEEKKWNDLFREKVGTHWDYDEAGKRLPGSVKPQQMWWDYYLSLENRSPRDYSSNRIVGWFEWLWGSAEATGD